MRQLVGECAALAHRLPGAGHTDDDAFALRIMGRQTVLVRADVEHRDVDPGRLFDQRDEIPEGLCAQSMVPPESIGGVARLGFRVVWRHIGVRVSTGGRRRAASPVGNGLIVQGLGQLEEVQERVLYAGKLRRRRAPTGADGRRRGCGEGRRSRGRRYWPLAAQAVSTTGEAPISGAHQDSLSRYQATVERIPSAKVISGAQPSSVRSLDESSR